MALQHPTQIIKSQDTVIKIGALAAGKRVNIAKAAASTGVLTMPSSGNVPNSMLFLGGVTNASISFNDGEQEYYVLGGGGFADSVKTTQRVTASITSYLQKDFDGDLVNTEFDEAMNLVARSRQEVDLELYVNIHKHVGGTTYDTVIFCGAVVNYQESYPADNLIEVTFDLVSRGVIGIGKATISTSPMPTDQGADHQT